MHQQRTQRDLPLTNFSPHSRCTLLKPNLRLRCPAPPWLLVMQPWVHLVLNPPLPINQMSTAAATLEPIPVDWAPAHSVIKNCHRSLTTFVAKFAGVH